MADQSQFEGAKAAQSRLEVAQQQVEHERAHFHEAIRQLYVGGVTLREIAEELGLSHQRVHQIVDGGLTCSFCGAAQVDVLKLIAGPGVYICDRCVTLAVRVVGGEAAVSNERTSIQEANLAANPKCSFCRQKANTVGRMAESGGARICGRCLGNCGEILAKERQAVSRRLP